MKRLLWGMVAVLATAAITWTALDEDLRLIPLGLIGALLAVFLIARPTLLAGAAIGAIVFAQTIEHLAGGGVLGLVDDAIVGLAIVGLPLGAFLRAGRLRAFPHAVTVFVFAYLLIGVLSAIPQDVALGTAGAGLYLAARPFLLAWALLQVDWDAAKLGRFGRAGVMAMWVVIAMGAANLAAPAAWTAIFASNPIPEYNGFVPGIVGPFAHPSFFGQFLALGVIALVAYRVHVGKKHTALIVAGAGFSLLSFRRKTLASLPAGVVQVLLSRRPGATIVALVLTLPLAAMVAWPQFSSIIASINRTYFVAPDENARSALTLRSLDVANSYFPLGAGFGRYGSSPAASDYSPEYIARGFDTIYGLEPRDPRFASDTFWPQVIGESGWLGLIAFLGILICVYVHFTRMTRSGSPMLRAIGAAGLGWTVMLTVESVAAPALSAPPTYGALPLLFAIGMVLSRDEQAPDFTSAPAHLQLRRV